MPKKPTNAAAKRPAKPAAASRVKPAVKRTAATPPAKPRAKLVAAKPTRALTGAAKAIADVDALTWTGQPQAAIARATLALDSGDFSADQQADLLDLRAENYFVRGEMDLCAADAQALAELAKRMRSPAIKARALLRRAFLQTRRGEMAEALTNTRDALTLARRGDFAELEGRALTQLATTLGMQVADLKVALGYARRAETMFHKLERPALQVRALLSQFNILTAMGRIDDANAAVANALALAQQCSDYAGQGQALNMLTFHEPDQAKSMQRYQQALAAFSAGGVVSGKAAVIGNLGITYLNLGLVHRARRLLLESDRMQRELGNKLGIVTNAWNLLLHEQLLRHPDRDRSAYAGTRGAALRGPCLPHRRAVGASRRSRRRSRQPFCPRGRGARQRRRRPADGIPDPGRSRASCGGGCRKGAGILPPRD